MTDLTARLSSHDDPRLYREADELMQEAAAEITRLRAEMAGATASAMEEAACLFDVPEAISGECEEWSRDVAQRIRAAITKGAEL